MSDPQPGPDPALDQYEVPLEPVEFEERIQRSRFLAQVFPVGSRDEAMAKLEELKALSHKANHHCPALKLGHPLDGPETWSSDDGEPSGSAGMPILRAIDGSGLSDLLVVVTRWFGGVKLGTGGLVRAYGGVAKAALDAAARRTIIRRDTLEPRFDYPLMTRVLRLASECEAVEQNRICDTHVSLSLAVARSRVSRLEEQLTELMQGQGEIRRL